MKPWTIAAGLALTSALAWGAWCQDKPIYGCSGDVSGPAGCGRIVNGRVVSSSPATVTCPHDIPKSVKFWWQDIHAHECSVDGWRTWFGARHGCDGSVTCFTADGMPGLHE